MIGTGLYAVLGLAVVDIALLVTPVDKMDVDGHENRRVVCAELAAVCDLVVDFSPLRESSSGPHELSHSTMTNGGR